MKVSHNLEPKPVKKTSYFEFTYLFVQGPHLNFRTGVEPVSAKCAPKSCVRTCRLSAFGLKWFKIYFIVLFLEFHPFSCKIALTLGDKWLQPLLCRTRGNDNWGNRISGVICQGTLIVIGPAVKGELWCPSLAEWCPSHRVITVYQQGGGGLSQVALDWP